VLAHRAVLQPGPRLRPARRASRDDLERCTELHRELAERVQLGFVTVRPRGAEALVEEAPAEPHRPV